MAIRLQRPITLKRTQSIITMIVGEPNNLEYHSHRIGKFLWARQGVEGGTGWKQPKGTTNTANTGSPVDIIDVGNQSLLWVKTLIDTLKTLLIDRHGHVGIRPA